MVGELYTVGVRVRFQTSTYTGKQVASKYNLITRKWCFIEIMHIPWKYFPHMRQAYTLMCDREMEQSFSKSKSSTLLRDKHKKSMGWASELASIQHWDLYTTECILPVNGVKIRTVTASSVLRNTTSSFYDWHCNMRWSKQVLNCFIHFKVHTG